MPSSVIRHFNYYPDTEVLSITFVSGLIYHYKKVPQKIYKMLKVAGSKGTYFNHYIKDKFEYKLINEV